MKAAEIRDLIAWLNSLLPHRKPKPPGPKPTVKPPKGKQKPPAKFHPRFGLDWAWGTISAGAMISVGADFACRYLSWDTSKNLRKLEARGLRRRHIDIVTVWESGGNRALEGFSAGVKDAIEADRQLKALGAPANAPILFAIDFDETPGNAIVVQHYFDGIAHVLPVFRIGAYGGYWAIKRLFDSRRIHYGWQTYAWSGTNWDTRAQLRQFSNSHRVGGTDCDFNRAMAPDFGQWPR